MFTGITTNTTKIISSEPHDGGLKITFATPSSWNDLKLGESILTDGTCLTVSALIKQSYECHLMPETLKVSTFGQTVPELVNLERALILGDRLDGHIVQGHVDTIGRITKVNKGDDYQLTISIDPTDHNLVVRKGSITVNGVSLTVVDATNDSFSVALVPYTLKHTAFSALSQNDIVNVEFDIIGKYVANLMEKQ